jgi:hypothetical protein
MRWAGRSWALAGPTGYLASRMVLVVDQRHQLILGKAYHERSDEDSWPQGADDQGMPAEAAGASLQQMRNSETS